MNLFQILFPSYLLIHAHLLLVAHIQFAKSSENRLHALVNQSTPVYHRIAGQNASVIQSVLTIWPV